MNDTDTHTVSIPAIAAADGEYVLRMRGDSMTDTGIHDGDCLVVKSAESAQDGQIVVATIGNEATVKRYFAEPDGSVRLEPANKDIVPIQSTDVKVIGLVVGLFREVT